MLRTLADIAARGQLTRSRLAPLWLTLDRNLEWWTKGALLRSGQRIEFEGSELVWQYYPGQGIQLQMLGNFGKLNGLWGGRENARLALMLDELLPLAAERAGGVAWEYYFNFGGGRPPWVSGLAQGTAVQALARAATRLDREADVLPVAKRALAIFEAPTPQGVRVPAEHGDHYAIYSFAPNLRVLNGFIQALIGLYDYARLGADPRGTALFQAGESRGARGGPGLRHRRVVAVLAREQHARVHALLPRPAAGLPRRTSARARRPTSTARPPSASSSTRACRRWWRCSRARCAAGVRAGCASRSRRSRTWTCGSGAPASSSRRARSARSATASGPSAGTCRAAPATYTVQLIVRDLAGNPAAATGTVKVLKPKRKKRH